MKILAITAGGMLEEIRQMFNLLWSV